MRPGAERAITALEIDIPLSLPLGKEEKPEEAIKDSTPLHPRLSLLPGYHRNLNFKKVADTFSHDFSFVIGKGGIILIATPKDPVEEINSPTCLIRENGERVKLAPDKSQQFRIGRQDSRRGKKIAAIGRFIGDQPFLEAFLSPVMHDKIPVRLRSFLKF